MIQKIIKELGFIGLTFLIGCGVSHVNYIQEPYENDQKTIANLLQEIFTSAQNKQLDRLESYHLYGPKFSKFDDWEPLTRQNAEIGKKSEREAFQSISKFTYQINDLKVDVFGPVAIATFVLNYDLDMGKDKAKAKARSTMVFVKDGSLWKITHEHFSPFKSNP